MRAEADRALLERLFGETGASRSLSEPGWQEYVRDLSLAVADWLSDALAPVARSLGARLEWLEFAAAAFVIVTLGLLVFFVGRSVVLGLSRRSPAAREAVVARPALPRVGTRAAAQWRAEIEACLARGDVAAALSALWWWLASALLSREVDPTWTSRELLERAERRDLLPLANLLDRHAYGPVRPGAGDVRGLARRFEELLG